MTIEFKPPLICDNIEAQLGEILKKPLPSLSNAELETLWTTFISTYGSESVPNAVTFFTTFMPPLEVNALYEDMIDNTLTNSFDILYNEPQLKTLFKILGSDINLSFRKKYLFTLLGQADILSKLQAQSPEHVYIMTWIKIRDASHGINKIQLLYSLLHANPKLPWMTDIVEKFFQSQEVVLTRQLNDDLKILSSKLPYDFESQLKEIISLDKNSALARQIFIHLGNLINDESIALEKRLEIFKASLDPLCVTTLGENINYQSIYSQFFCFVQQNWHNEELKNFLMNEGYSFTQRLLPEIKLDPATNYDALLSMIQDPNYLKNLHSMPFLLKKTYTMMLNKLYLVDLKINQDSDPKIFEAKLNNLVADLHKDNLKQFSQMIFSENTENEPLASQIPLTAKEIIYNQQGYDQGINLPSTTLYKTGNALTLDDGTPIGYNIHLPSQKPKGVFVHVYGGFESKQRKEKMFYPDNLSNLEKDLIKKGIVVVTLNLADLIESQVYQSELPKEIEDKIQASIHQFYSTLKFNPTKLHPTLQLPDGISYCLYGASFGGRTVVKHAQRYPNTFERIISFDGALSYEMQKKSDLAFAIGRFASSDKAQVYLDAMNDIEKIKDDVLLLHNMNDNNVNLKVTLDWFKKAKKAGKNKVRLHITEKGNPVEPQDLINTGHFPPKGQTSFNNLMEVIFNHIQEGSATLPTLTDWRALRYNILANKNYKSASIEEKFISLAYRMHKQGVKITDDSFKEKYITLYYMLNYLSTIPVHIQLQEVIAMNQTNLLTEEVITRGLESYFKQFLDFVKEKEGIKLPDKINIANLLKNQNLRDQYRDTLIYGPEGNSINFSYILATLYEANPQLFKSYAQKWDQDPIIQNNFKKAVDKLHKKLDKEEKTKAQVWQQTVNQMQKTDKVKKIALTWKEKTLKSKQKLTQTLPNSIDVANIESKENNLKPPKK